MGCNLPLRDCLSTLKTDRFPNLKSHSVYFFESEDGEILYIGKSSPSNFCARMSAHSGYKYFKDVHSVSVLCLSTFVDATVVESYLIAKHKPKFNKDMVHEDCNVAVEDLSDKREFIFEVSKWDRKVAVKVDAEPKRRNTSRLNKIGNFLRKGTVLSVD